MKGFFGFMGQFLEGLVFTALAGLVGYLAYLSWDTKDVYHLVSAVAVTMVLGLLIVLDTTARTLGKMDRITKSIAQSAATTLNPAMMRLTHSQPLPVDKPATAVPSLNEAIDRLNKRKADEQAEQAKQATVATEKPVSPELKSALSELASKAADKIAEKPVEKPAEKPAPAPESAKPVIPPAPPVEQPVKKYPFGRKPKELPTPTTQELAQAVVNKAIKDEMNKRVEKIVEEIKSNGNGMHNEDTATAQAKVCPKCGVKGQMVKFGLHQGRQKWHCGGCGKTMIEPQKKIGVGA